MFWLEEYLKSYKSILLLLLVVVVVVSHYQDFLNGVCTKIMHLHRNKLIYYTGNYDEFVKSKRRKKRRKIKMKQYNWEQASQI